MSNGRLAYQRHRLGIEEPNERLIEIHGFYQSLRKRDGDNCQLCGASKMTLLKNNEHLIPTVLDADMFHKNAYRNRKLELDKTKLFCRPCHNAYGS